MAMPAQGQVVSLLCTQLVPNPMQPRHIFDPIQLERLATSITQFGVLQPLLVRQNPDHQWEIIAGERRWRASQLAGLDAVPCIITQASDEASALQAMVENVQRQDLHYLEQARAIHALLKQTQATQEELSKQLGMAPSSVANKLRLLRLGNGCVTLLLEHQLSERHARALLSLDDDAQREDALRHIIAQGLNVAQSERYIQKILLHLATTPPLARRNYVIKDVRLFLNTIDRSLRVMQDAGIDAQYHREDKDDAIYLTVRIPKHPKSQATG